MNKKWIIIILAVLIIGVIIWLIIKQKETYFKPIVIENNNNIINTLKNVAYLDTIVYAGVKGLNLSGLIIIIHPLTDQMKKSFSSELDLKACIIGDENVYNIYVDTSMNRLEYITTFSHELIHLKQYYNRELIIKNNIATWKGEQINLSNVAYQDRQWEIEAFSNQKELEIKMNKILKKIKSQEKS